MGYIYMQGLPSHLVGERALFQASGAFCEQVIIAQFHVNYSPIFCCYLPYQRLVSWWLLMVITMDIRLAYARISQLVRLYLVKLVTLLSPNSSGCILVRLASLLSPSSSSCFLVMWAVVSLQIIQLFPGYMTDLLSPSYFCCIFFFRSPLLPPYYSEPHVGRRLGGQFYNGKGTCSSRYMMRQVT